METRKQFISRMAWLLSEIRASEKGSILDAMKLLEFHLSAREGLLEDDSRAMIRKHIYENVDGNKGKVFINFLDVYETQNKKKL